ncbi:hypothetical protein F4806DRAFT_458959 [Annulohypoxylon nitens]|nr:hypothetical protein F4806DRAFT_458959 [Annulohypoxylon nitens]
MNAYEPRDLLNYTVAAFHSRSDAELSKFQLQARKDFISLFKEQLIAYDGKRITAIMSESSKKDIKEFFQHLDDFFFFGRLWDNCEINSGLNIIGPWGYGDASQCTKDGRSYVQIRIELGVHDGIYDLDTIVGTVIHEMVHAYIMLFVCDCNECDKDSLNTKGPPNDVHGPIFQMFYRLILTELRRWGACNNEDKLRTLDEPDCPGQSMSLNSRKGYEYTINHMSRAEVEKYNSFRRQQDPLYLIRYSENGNEVVVEPRLKANQIKMENELRYQTRGY